LNLLWDLPGDGTPPGNVKKADKARQASSAGRGCLSRRIGQQGAPCLIGGKPGAFSAERQAIVICENQCSIITSMSQKFIGFLKFHRLAQILAVVAAAAPPLYIDACCPGPYSIAKISCRAKGSFVNE